MFRYAFLMTTSAVADAPKAAAIFSDVAATVVAVTAAPADGARS